MSYKRGQLTVIVIIGVLVVMVIGGYFVIKGVSSGDGLFKRDSLENSVANSVEACYKQMFKDGLNEVGLQGGYYIEPFTRYSYIDDYMVPFYYFEGEEIYMPSLEMIRGSLQSYYFDSASRCIYNAFDGVENGSYDFEIKSFNVNVTKDSVDIYYVTEINFFGEDKTIKIVLDDDYSVKSSLYGMYELANFINKYHYIDDGMTCLDCLDNLQKKYSLNLVSSTLFDGAVMVSISPNEEDSYPEVFQFLEAYGQTDYLEQIKSNDTLMSYDDYLKMKKEESSSFFENVDENIKTIE